MKLGCVIMAAGASSRFGENKLLQDFLGKPLFTCVLNAAEGVFEKTVVVTGYEIIEKTAEKMGFLSVKNEHPELGVSHTIRLGSGALQDCDGVVFATADQPLLSRETLCRLAAEFGKEPSCIHAVCADGKRGNPCVFPKSLFGELVSLEGDTGGGAVIKAHSHLLRLLEVPSEELLDCDTPAALVKCREKAAKKLEKREKTI